MRVIGIDPGTVRTGVGVIEKDGVALKTLHFETISIASQISLPRRLQKIFNSLQEIFKLFHPDVTAIESVFFHRSVRTAVAIGEARAVAILASTLFDVPVVEYPPARVKSAICGTGMAKKHQMQYMIRGLLGLRTTPPADAADALAVALCHVHSEKMARMREALRV